MSSKWLALTAGVGNRDFELAAKRVCEKIIGFPQISKCVTLTTNDLLEFCPSVSRAYSEYLNSSTRGYGYMSYKAEMVFNAFKGQWGNYDGVIWVDAGCEVLVNPFTIKRLDSILRFAELKGVSCFSIESPEIAYTKRDLFEIFPNVEPRNSGNQIQTTWFALNGELGREIAGRWFKTIMMGIHYLDLNPSSKPEFPEFIENRYDQSVFSLVCKDMKIEELRYLPVDGRLWKSQVRGTIHPIWTARNRTGSTIIPAWLRATEKVNKLIRRLN